VLDAMLAPAGQEFSLSRCNDDEYIDEEVAGANDTR
jgi:hypothetical protein